MKKTKGEVTGYEQELINKASDILSYWSEKLGVCIKPCIGEVYGRYSRVMVIEAKDGIHLVIDPRTKVEELKLRVGREILYWYLRKYLWITYGDQLKDTFQNIVGEYAEWLMIIFPEIKKVSEESDEPVIVSLVRIVRNDELEFVDQEIDKMARRILNLLEKKGGEKDG